MHDDLEQAAQPLLHDHDRNPPGNRHAIWTCLVWIWRICIFAVTGSSSVAVTRFILQHGALDPWLYYTAFFVLELVVYTVMIVVIGTCLGQRRFFCAVANKMWGWLIPGERKNGIIDSSS